MMFKKSDFSKNRISKKIRLFPKSAVLYYRSEKTMKLTRLFLISAIVAFSQVGWFRGLQFFKEKTVSLERSETAPYRC